MLKTIVDYLKSWWESFYVIRGSIKHRPDRDKLTSGKFKRLKK
jgi:hypothetical protein